MEHVRIGESGLIGSRLALGTMTFGLRCDESTSRQIFDRARAGGVTLVDTADVYPYAGDGSTVGHTEELLGRWLRGVRHEVVLATKVGGQTGPHLWDVGNSRSHIIRAVEASLRRLQTDHVDVLQLHGYDDQTPMEETIDTLTTLVHTGKVRYVGVSNFRAYQLAAMAHRTALAGAVPITVNQPRYSLLARGIEAEILPAARAFGIGTMVYNPLAGGMLSGRYGPGSEAGEGRFGFGTAAATYRARYWNDRVLAAVERLGVIATELGTSLATMSLAWVLTNPDIDVAVIGASSPEHVDTAVAALDLDIPTDVLDRLAEISDPFRQADGVNAGLPQRG